MKHPGLAGPEIEKPLRRGLRFQVQELVASQFDITIDELLRKLGRTQWDQHHIRNIAEGFRSDVRFLHRRGNLRRTRPGAPSHRVNDQQQGRCPPPLCRPLDHDKRPHPSPNER
jgi:hypothetical protein